MNIKEEIKYIVERLARFKRIDAKEGTIGLLKGQIEDMETTLFIINQLQAENKELRQITGILKEADND